MKRLPTVVIIAAILGFQPLHATAATREEIAATIAAACSGGGDCQAAVNAAIALASDPKLTVAVGQGLADSVAQVEATSPDLATVILVTIAQAPTEVQMAYQIALDVATASVTPSVPQTPAAATQSGSPN
jgi:hypothetical protein